MPRLIFDILEHTIELAKAKSLSDEEIFDAICLKNDWTEAREKQLDFVKSDLNEGSFRGLHSETDLTVLYQLLYDWLEDCTFHVIRPDKISELAEQSIIKEILDDSAEKNKPEELRKFLRGELRSLEYNTIAKIVQFFSFLMPIDYFMVPAFEESCELLASLLLGYGDIKTEENLSDVQSTNIKVVSRIFDCLTEKGKEIQATSVMKHNLGSLTDLNSLNPTNIGGSAYSVLVNELIETFMVENRINMEGMEDDKILTELLEFVKQKTIEIPGNAETFKTLVKNALRPDPKLSSHGKKLNLFTPTSKMPDFSIDRTKIEEASKNQSVLKLSTNIRRKPISTKKVNIIEDLTSKSSFKKNLDRHKKRTATIKKRNVMMNTAVGVRKIHI